MEDLIKKFLEQLKEEALPGVWSKGIALSRASKGIERISGGNTSSEWKYKLQTTERTLAYQVTLWPKDFDSHCNCGSKVEPCHHIVAVALAAQRGLDEPRESETTSAKNDSATLLYTWVIDSDLNVRLKREIQQGTSKTLLNGSLVGLIGGIHSGRVKSPLPPTSTADLKIDELLAKPALSWPHLLKAASDFPPFSVEWANASEKFVGIQKLTSSPRMIRNEWIIENAPQGFSVRMEERMKIAELALRNGIALFKGEETGIAELGLLAPSSVSQHSMSIPASLPYSKQQQNSPALEQFILKTLPRLREDFTVTILAQGWPEVIEGEPHLELKVQALTAEILAVTPLIVYSPPPFGYIQKRDESLEANLTRQVRQDYQLVVGQPAKLDPEAAFLFREKLEQENAKPLMQSLLPIDQFLGGFVQDLTGDLREWNFADALKNKSAILRLFQLKKDSPAAAKTLGKHLARTFTPLSLSDEDKIPLQIPRKLWVQLRDYQKQGVQFLASHIQDGTGAILADDMGLGKTIQTLSILQKPALVVVPTSLIHNWKTEAEKFRPDLKVQIFHGADRKGLNFSEADLTITTYGTLRQDPERFLNQVWGTAVLDEAHFIRNADTQISTLCLQLNARFKLALTGTPIQNKARDLYTLFQFVAPGVFSDEQSLKKEWISPYLLRRTKSEVLTELPPKSYLDHEVELSVPEREFYQAIWGAAKKEILALLEASEKASPLTIFEVLLRARQICDHAGMVDPASWSQSSSKLELLMELIEELTEAGHSVLVYSQWTRFLDRIEGELRRENREWLRLDGTTRNRGEILGKFQEELAPGDVGKVFLLSLQAGGVGLNLTRADHVIFCDPWWNPYVELQAEDRAYRMGQERPVTIHRLICTNTIEEKIRVLQAQKRKLEGDYLDLDKKEGTSLGTSLLQTDLQLLLSD